MGLELTHCSRSHRLPCGVCHGLQPTVGTLFKMTDEVLNQSFFGALPLSYGVVISIDADGTRTHNIRLGTHGLQLGSRSCTQCSDEVWTRGTPCGSRTRRPHDAAPDSLDGHDGLQTGSRCVSVFNCPTKERRDCRLAATGSQPVMESRPAVGPFDDTTDEEVVRTRHFRM